MTTTINGSYPSVNSDTDATINGLTVGKGAGAVSTNTAVGASALGGGSQSGGFNSVLGYQAGVADTTGNGFVAIGYQSMLNNTTGSDSTSVGYQSLAANTTGGSNVAIGSRALYSNTTASYNTAVGYQAGYANTTGTGNVFLGFSAGLATTTGNYNTLIGRSAGLALTTGLGNTFVGGYNASTGGSGAEITTGTKNTILGTYTGNQGGLDIRTASNYIVLSDGDGNPRIYVTNTGTMVLNGDGAGGATFYCLGTYNATTASGANVWVRNDGAFLRSTSALKYKQDVRNLESMDINKLRPVRYKSNCEHDDQTKDHLGLIADEAAESGFEELVTRGAEGEVEGFQYERLTVVLLKSLQELKAEVDFLKQQLGK